MEGLFTYHCSKVNQLCDLMDALQVCEHHLMGDYTSSAQLILQVIWALTLTACNFFKQVCTRSQLEPTTRAPWAAKATLSTYTHVITMKMCLDLDGLPMQWTPQAPHTQVQDQPHQHSQTSSPKEHQTKFWCHAARPDTTEQLHHPNWLPIFANNDTIKQLLTKQGRILMQIFMEASIQGSGNCLDLTGLPDNICLHQLILGRCGGSHGQECK